MLSRTYDTVKGAGSSTLAWLKKNGLATVFSTGRVGSSAGGVVQSAESIADKGYRAYMHDPSVSAPQGVKAPVVFASVSANIIVNLATRITAIFRYFSEADSDIRYKAELPGEAENLFDHIDENPGWFSNWIRPEFELKYNGVLIFVRLMLYVSLSFMFLNSFFSSMKLYELFLHLFTSTLDMSNAELVAEIILALFFALSNVIATLSLNIPTSMNNVVGIIKEVKKGNAKLTPTLAATAVVGMLNLISTVFGTYYNTSNAFVRYKKMVSLLDTLLSATTTKLLILMSTSGAVVSEISRLPFLHGLLTNLGTRFRNRFFPSNELVLQASAVDNTPPPSYWLKLKVLVMGAAVVDAAFTGMVNFNSFPSAIKDLSSLDPEHAAIKAGLIFTGISTASVTFAATWQATELHQENLIRNAKNEARIIGLEEIAIDSDESDEEGRQLLSSSARKNEFTFFKPKASDRVEEEFFDVIEPIDDSELFKGKKNVGLLDSSSESSESSGSEKSNQLSSSGESKFRL